MKKIMRLVCALLLVLFVSLAGSGCSAKAKKAYHLSRADRYYTAGEFGQAEIEYLNTLRYDNANAQAYGRLGLIYYEQGRLQRALYFLIKGSDLAPEADPNLRLKLGFILSSVGLYSNALVNANFVLAKKPLDDDAPILLVEASILPKDAAAARLRLQTLIHNGDRAAYEVALANLDLREHDVAAAGIAAQKAQALEPKSSAVNAALAMVAWAKGDLKQTEAFFKLSSDAAPLRSPRRMQYVRFKTQTGDLVGARATLAEIIKAAPDYVPASMVLAEIAAAEKKYDECTEMLAKVLKLDPDNFDALFFQGQLDMARGKPDQAVTDLERMVRIYPQVPYVHYQLGTAYAAVNDLAKAANSLNRALEMNPNFIEATLLLAEIEIRDGNAAPAIITLEKVRQKQPRNLPAQLLLADGYRLQDRDNDALAIYQSLGTMYPTNTKVAFLRGAVLLHLKDNAGARKAFQQVLELAPADLSAIEKLVDLDISENQSTNATRLLAGEIQAYPKQAPLRLLLARTQLMQGKPDLAETTLLQTLEIDPANQGTYLLLAQLYTDTGRRQKGMEALNAGLAKDPENTAALMLAATIYEANHDHKAAADAYERVLKVDPKLSPALNNLAYLYSENLDNVDRAYELAQRARALLPFDPSTADTLGWICYRRGAYDIALGLLKESATKLTGANQPPEALSEIQFHFGMANYMTANEAPAQAALQLAMDTCTNFPGRVECGLCLSILNLNPDTADAAARAMLLKRVAERADDPVALTRLARIYVREGTPDKAIAAYEAVVQATPKNINAMLSLARLYAIKDPRKAYDLAKTANKAAPYDPETAHLLGQMAFQAGDYNLATSMLQQARQYQPNNASLLYDYALAAYSIGKIPETQSALQTAVGLNLPTAQAVQAQRMLDLIALAANPAQAVAASARVGEILKSEPNNVPALMARAAASQGSDAAAATQAYEKVLAQYPDFIPAQRQLAQLYLTDTTKTDRAYALAMKLHDTLPDDPSVNKILGIVLVLRGDYSHAVNLLKQSASKLNSDAEVYYYLGAAQFHLKNNLECKANLQQALALKLSGQLADSAKQMLNGLK